MTGDPCGRVHKKHVVLRLQAVRHDCPIPISHGYRRWDGSNGNDANTIVKNNSSSFFSSRSVKLNSYHLLIIIFNFVFSLNLILFSQSNFVHFNVFFITFFFLHLLYNFYAILWCSSEIYHHFIHDLLQYKSLLG